MKLEAPDYLIRMIVNNFRVRGPLPTDSPGKAEAEHFQMARTIADRIWREAYSKGMVAGIEMGSTTIVINSDHAILAGDRKIDITDPGGKTI